MGPMLTAEPPSKAAWITDFATELTVRIRPE